MTDKDALNIADRPDWWMGPDGSRVGMRTLRAALDDVRNYTGRPFLFRPGGFGVPAIWLAAEEIVQFRTVLGAQNEPAA